MNAVIFVVSADFIAFFHPTKIDSVILAVYEIKGCIPLAILALVSAPSAHHQRGSCLSVAHNAQHRLSDGYVTSRNRSIHLFCADVHL